MTSKLEHLAHFCHRRDAEIPFRIKLDPWRAIRISKEDCFGRITYPVSGVIWHRPPHDRCGQFLCSIVSRIGDLTGTFVMVNGLLDTTGV